MESFEFFSPEITVAHNLSAVPEPEQFHLHAHRSYEFYYFISGNGYYTVEGNDYPLIPGCILLMRDGEAHYAHINSSEPYERLVVNFDRDLFPDLSDEIDRLFCDRPLGKCNYFLPEEEAGKFIQCCLDRLCEKCDGNYLPRALSLMRIILSEMSDMSSTSLSSVNAKEKKIHQGSSEMVYRIIGYINDNLTAINSMEMLEREFFFSKSYLNRIFKQSTGSSIWDYIILKRLLLARSLLNAGASAASVAVKCGFNDYSSFYRQFRRRFGTSPLEVRQKK